MCVVMMLAAIAYVAFQAQDLTILACALAGVGAVMGFFWLSTVPPTNGIVAVLFGTIGCYLLLNRGDADLEPTATGEAADIAEIDLRTGRTALVFLSTSCLTCREIFTAFGSVASGLPGGVRPVIVIKDEIYGAADIDMTPQLTNIKNTNGVQAVINCGFGQGPAIVTRNYRQLGITLPLIGRVAAGSPILAAEHIELTALGGMGRPEPSHRAVAEDAARNLSAPVDAPFKVVTRKSQL